MTTEEEDYICKHAARIETVEQDDKVFTINVYDSNNTLLWCAQNLDNSLLDGIHQVLESAIAK